MKIKLKEQPYGFSKITVSLPWEIGNEMAFWCAADPENRAASLQGEEALL